MRTFYWDARVLGRARVLRRRLLGKDNSNVFRVGNAGDIYNVNLIRDLYGLPPRNVKDEGRRLLLVGSVAHNIRNGDVVCGVGTQGIPIPSARDVSCEILGVRGPLTLAAMAQAGYDVAGVRFQYDPGLLIRFQVPSRAARHGRMGFLPHYRERMLYKGRVPLGLHVVDIDGDPFAVAKQIQGLELLYTSSLHGLIFAHALGRPCVLVKPLTEEPELKYRDYLASVGLPWTPWVTLDEALRSASPVSPADVRYERSDFHFPELDDLRGRGIAD